MCIFCLAARQTPSSSSMAVSPADKRYEPHWYGQLQSPYVFAFFPVKKKFCVAGLNLAKPEMLAR